MPTDHPRISVTKDPVLAAALSEVSARVESRVKEATLVRDLAVEGARHRLAAERRDSSATEFIELSMTLAGLDRDVLMAVKEPAA